MMAIIGKVNDTPAVAPISLAHIFYNVLLDTFALSSLLNPSRHFVALGLKVKDDEKVFENVKQAVF